MGPLFGAKVGQLRRLKNLGLHEVCGPMNWSPSYLSEVESSKRNPPKAHRIRELATVLGAEEHLPELLELANCAAIPRCPVVGVPAEVDAEIACAIYELGRGILQGRISLDHARRITRTIKGEI